MAVVLDIPELKVQVARLLAEYRKKPVLDVSDQEIPILQNFRHMIGQCVMSVVVSDPAEWKRQGIRIVNADPSKAFGGCFCDEFGKLVASVKAGNGVDINKLICILCVFAG